MINGPFTRRGVLVGAVASAAVLTINRSIAAEPTVHEVRIKKLKFVPKKITVKAGDSIRWINDDIAAHTASAEEFGWDTGEIISGGTAEVVVQKDMETRYFCAYHPHMKGSFTIV